VVTVRLVKWACQAKSEKSEGVFPKWEKQRRIHHREHPSTPLRAGSGHGEEQAENQGQARIYADHADKQRPIYRGNRKEERSKTKGGAQHLD